ncbi:MAG: NPCBM/NEW2 domain-containing protein [Tannerella sp.]|nr:NPCBM/NEW2 domain-containing protein [Tannerella sp.]
MSTVLFLLAVLLSASCVRKSYEVVVPDSDLAGKNEITFLLDGKKGQFNVQATLDAKAEGDATVRFYVITSKGVAFRSGDMHKGDTGAAVSVDLKGVTELCLYAEPVKGDKAIQKVAWKDARFVVQTEPVLQTPAAEEPYILTPAPAAVPRINGAKIVGASALKPFMFNIATTGERPLRFEATGLPEGLTLDAGKGLITGVATKEGRYIVPVTAKNSKGECRDTLEIVIGGELALTPHMGWNSWYCHQTRVTQNIMEKSAQAMYDKGLINFGYTFVNIDDGWEVKVNSDDPMLGGQVRNPDGTIRTNKNFPDMRKMTDYIHSLGLKAGLYSSPGWATCAEYAGSLDHEVQDVKSYCDWGFDFLKYDWCSYGREVKHPVSQEDLKRPYILIDSILRQADRDIILNLCQYGMGEVWKWGKEVGGHSWRTAGDIGWSTSELINSMFTAGFFQETIRQYTGPGGWNDPDYLLFGKIWNWEEERDVLSPMSPSEQYTCMTLWCMMSAPLIFSGELVSLDEFTQNILCNAEVIDINQDKLGKSGYSIYKQDFTEIWKKELHDGSTAIAIFNKSPFKSLVSIDWRSLGYDAKNTVRDLWRQQDLGVTTKTSQFEIPRHGCVLLKVR